MTKKDKEIDPLKKANQDQIKQITELKDKVFSYSDQSNISPPKPALKILPKLYQRIRFQVAGENNEKLVEGKVIKKNKPSSVRKNVVGIKLDDGLEKHYDFSIDIDNWSDINEPEAAIEPCCLYSFTEENNIQHETFATVLTKAEIKGRPDVDKAMSDEIKKFESFDAFRRVTDDGQYAIKTRWVVTENDDDSKGYKLKARLCMRGDTEQNTGNIRVDSPTAHKDSLKLALAISANEGFEIVSADIKSAFLQGKSLDRKVYVIPPAEAKEEGNLWLLEKGAYGLMDGSRLFYLELKEKLLKLGMNEVSGDSALFTMQKDGKLIGLVCSHVDDLFMAG